MRNSIGNDLVNNVYLLLRLKRIAKFVCDVIVFVDYLVVNALPCSALCAVTV